MTYVKSYSAWADKPTLTTPATAAKMQNIDDGVYNAHYDTRHDATATGTVPAKFYGFSAGQTADLSQWLTSAGTVRAKVDVNGAFTTVIGAASAVGQTIQAASSQTADLHRWTTSAGTIFNRVEADGSQVVGYPVQTTYQAVTAGTRLAVRSSTDLIDEYAKQQTATVTIASPGVFTSVNHHVNPGGALYFTTTGALPTGLTANTIYYVLTAGWTKDTFEVSTTPGASGTPVNTSGSQSGTHTMHAVVPAGTEVFRVNQYGDIICGSQNLHTSADFNNLTHWFNFAYLAAHRRIYTRSMVITEIGDAVDLNVRRGGDSSGPDVVRGTLTNMTIFALRGIPSGYPFGTNTATNPQTAMAGFANVGQASGKIAVQTAEDVIEIGAPGSGNYTTGGSLNFYTTPTGLTASATSDMWEQWRLSIRPTGAVVTMAGNMSGGDADGYGRGDLVSGGNVICAAKSYAATITIASPGVLTKTNHGLRVDDQIILSTTGALPTGLAANTLYWVVSVPTASTFTVSGSSGGTAINTTGSQSGTHSYINGTFKWPLVATQATVGAAGSASAPPATPDRWLKVQSGSSVYVIPAYKA